DSTCGFVCNKGFKACEDTCISSRGCCTDTDCKSGQVCGPTNMCQSPQGPGHACNADNQCTTGVCTNGKCACSTGTQQCTANTDCCAGLQCNPETRACEPKTGCATVC